MDLVTLRSIITQFKQRALIKRAERIRQRRDNKIISGWNRLTLTGFLEAYQATGKTNKTKSNENCIKPIGTISTEAYDPEIHQNKKVIKVE